jgi:hypothetical protein
MHETRRLYAQPPVLILKEIGDVIDVRIQGGQDQRHSLPAQELERVAALSHHAVEQLHSSHLSAGMGIKVDVAKQRKKIPSAAQHRYSLHRSETQLAPALERDIDAGSASGAGAPAEHAATRQPVERIRHLA